MAGELMNAAQVRAFVLARIEDEERAARNVRVGLDAFTFPINGEPTMVTIVETSTEDGGYVDLQRLYGPGLKYRLYREMHPEIWAELWETLPMPEESHATLRRCAAHRKVVAEAELWSDQEYPDYDGGFASGLDAAVQSLAEIWSDHADFDAEWVV